MDRQFMGAQEHKPKTNYKSVSVNRMSILRKDLF